MYYKEGERGLPFGEVVRKMVFAWNAKAKQKCPEDDMNAHLVGQPRGNKGATYEKGDHKRSYFMIQLVSGVRNNY